MPRFTQSQLRWSEQTQTYVVFIDDQARAQMHVSSILPQIQTGLTTSRKIAEKSSKYL